MGCCSLWIATYSSSLVICRLSKKTSPNLQPTEGEEYFPQECHAGGGTVRKYPSVIVRAPLTGPLLTPLKSSPRLFAAHRWRVYATKKGPALRKARASDGCARQ